DPDVAGPGTRSQGYAQINTPTWHDFAPRAGVDLSQYPNAMSAPRDVQLKVASAIPFSRFGPNTQKALHAQFGDFDNRMTVGQLSSRYGGADVPSESAQPAEATSDYGGGFRLPGAGEAPAGQLGAHPPTMGDELRRSPGDYLMTVGAAMMASRA